METDFPILAAHVLMGFFENFDVLLLVMVRMIGFFMLLPVLSGATTPMTVRLSFAFALAYMLFMTGRVGYIEYTPNMIGYLSLILSEFLAGALMGFVANMAFATIYLVGQLIDYQIGFMMASLFDPISQIQVPVVGNILFFTMMALFVVTGGLSSFVAVIMLSFTYAPIGQIFIIENYLLMLYLLSLFTGFFLMGVQFALPIAGAIFIVNVMLGILVKAVPQMNIFVVGMPIKVLLGLTMMWYITPVFVTYYYLLFEYAADAIMSVVGAITPGDFTPW